MLVRSLSFQDAAADSGTEEVGWALDAGYADNGAYSYMDFVPLTILVNGRETTRLEDGDYYIYTAQEESLTLEIMEDCLNITAVEFGGTIPDGTYTIEIIVPDSHTESGGILWAAAILRVGDPGSEPNPGFRCEIENIVIENSGITVHIRDMDDIIGGTAFAAAYTADGRMCRLSLAGITGNLIFLPLNASKTAYVTVFIADQQLQPACRNQSVPMG